MTLRHKALVAVIEFLVSRGKCPSDESGAGALVWLEDMAERDPHSEIGRYYYTSSQAEKYRFWDAFEDWNQGRKPC